MRAARAPVDVDRLLRRALAPTALERRWRDALLASTLPPPGGALPALEALDLQGFWARFEGAAPLALLAGLRVSGAVVGGALPWCLGHAGSLDRLDADAREAVITRAHGLPGVDRLVDVAKIVAGLAYFSDPQAIAAAKRAP